MPTLIDRRVVGAAERAYYRWLEDVCLDEENRAFETDLSPFDDREIEVMRAVAANGRGPVTRGADLSPFLRRPGKPRLPTAAEEARDLVPAPV